MIEEVVGEEGFMGIEGWYVMKIDDIKFIEGKCVMVGGRLLKIGKE